MALLADTTYKLQFCGYEAATPFYERAAQPLMHRPVSPRVASVAGIMQLLHCARNCRGKRRLPEWPECLRGKGGKKGGFPRRFTTDVSPYVSFSVLIHSRWPRSRPRIGDKYDFNLLSSV